MKNNLLSLLLLLSIVAVSGCKDDGEDDDDDNGVPANTLQVNGSDINLSSTCTQYSSSYNLRLTAADVAQNHVLEINFNDYPTAATTFVIDNGGSGSEAWGSYTVNGNVEYDTQSGSATVTPVGTGFRVQLNNVVAEANGVEITLNFNGTCN